MQKEQVMFLSEADYLPCLQRLPERIVEKAVKGMLPSGRIGRHLFTHLKVHRLVSTF
jgi:large subunit ribosomal protein L13